MPPPVPEQISKTIETLYLSESGRVLATLVRLLGDLDLAEEAVHEAFAAALESWPQAGIPEKPRPWLISTARSKAIASGKSCMGPVRGLWTGHRQGHSPHQVVGRLGPYPCG